MKNKHRSPQKLYVFTLFISAILLIAMIVLFYLGNKLSTQHAPLVHASMEIKLEATTGHLWFEEIMGGDEIASIDGVWKNFERADWYAMAMLHGGIDGDYTVHPLSDPFMRDEIKSVREALSQFKIVAVERYNNFSESVPGTDIDQRFDAIFLDFTNKADKVEMLIQQQIAIELSRFHFLSYGLISLSSILAFFLSSFLFKKEVRQKDLFDSLVDANSFIEEKNKELDRMAHFDHLTGLPNRLLFADRLDQAIAHSQRKKSTFALLFIDLDHFKAVNDHYGHQQGDNLLQQTSNRLLRCIRDDDTLVRISGDEFAIILYDIDDVNSAINTANSISSRVIEKVRQPFDLKGTIAHITASIGVSIYPSDSVDPEELLRHADNAMYHAKSLGKNNYQFYAEELNIRAMHQVKIEHALQKAIDEDQFELYFHPQWELQTGKISGLEVLVRWQHPDDGLMFPDSFIPVAESCGLIQKLDELIFSKSLHQYKQWENKGFDIGCRISINVSSITFQQPSFLSIIGRLLAETGVKGESIEVEITEGVLIENSDVAQNTIQNLNKLGVDIAIDDFGTGYSSMAYLKDFSIQTLKIDRSFIADYHRHKTSNIILKNMVTLGNDLKMKVVAEGIETKEQEQHLKSLGCKIGQGYYLTKPIPLAEFERFIMSKNSTNISIFKAK